MAKKAGEAALADAKIPFTKSNRRSPATSTATRRAASARSTSSASPASRCSTSTTTARPALRAHARHPGGRRRHGRVRDRRRLRADGSGRAPGEVDRSREPARQVRQRDERGAGLQPGSARRADVRRRRSRVPLEVRHQERDVRQDRREGAPPRVEEPVRAVQGDVLARARSWRRRGLRSAHALPVLPADLRRGRGGALLATTSRRSTASRTRCTSRAK